MGNYFTVLALLVCSFGFADWSKIKSSEFTMAEPPEEGSVAFKRDYAELHRLQENRTDADCKLAAKQELPTFEAMFGAVPQILSQTEASKLEDLVARAMKFSVRVAGYFKNQFRRERPYSVDADLKPCIDLPGGSKAYPSSHASAASTGACVLAHLFRAKDKVTAIEEYGKYLGDLRAVVGVHHPSDVKAGQDLGLAICERLLTESDFKRELKRVKDRL